jgi:hypothetical protein
LNRIKICKLVARSTVRDYSLSFKNGLNIIAGESMTGKTSILQLINYCFGDTEYPETPEFQKLLVALLEIEIHDEVYTIERFLSNKKTATIHCCRIADLSAEHKNLDVQVIYTEGLESISSFILSQIGLQGIELKVAPSQSASDTHVLSFRNMLWVCYLKRSRVGGEQLLFEKEYWNNNKLIQVIEIVFNVYSNASALLGNELDSINKQIAAEEEKKKTIVNFLNSQGVLTTTELEEEIKKLQSETGPLKQRLLKIDEALTGSSDSAKDLRKEVLGLKAVLERIRTEKRGMEKELNLLLPLRAQYFEDKRKLTFLSDARSIIDPLLISRCPYCLKPIDKDHPKNICPVCNVEITNPSEESKVDVSKEISAIKRKSDELNDYIEKIRNNITMNDLRDKEISEKLSYLSNELDSSLKSYVSPFLAEHDELKTLIVTNDNKIGNYEIYLNFRKQIKEIEDQIIALSIKAKRLSIEIKDMQNKSANRAELIASLSATYLHQLTMVNYPKLENKAWVDLKFIPYVKGLRYDKLSSEGAINISSICWMTSLYAEAMKRLVNHPGFLILDSVQSGIGVGPDVNEEFKDVSIVKGVYSVLLEVSLLDNQCQLIVVDNHPPEYVKDNVIVRYTRDPKRPPYGFIDDEIG